MEMKVNEFKWASQSAQKDIELIWNQSKKKIIKAINEKLESENEKEEIPLFSEGISFEPDWVFPEDWRIVTLAKRIYTNNDSFIDSEKIQYISGRLIMLRAHSVPLDPSFKFVIDKDKGGMFINIRLIRKIMQERKELEDDSAYVNLSSDFLNNPLVYEGKSGLDERTERDLRNAFKYLNFNRDEINLMVHNVVTHESFEAGMKLEDLVRLGLDSAG